MKMKSMDMFDFKSNDKLKRYIEHVVIEMDNESYGDEDDSDEKTGELSSDHNSELDDNVEIIENNITTKYRKQVFKKQKTDNSEKSNKSNNSSPTKKSSGKGSDTPDENYDEPIAKKKKSSKRKSKSNSKVTKTKQKVEEDDDDVDEE